MAHQGEVGEVVISHADNILQFKKCGMNGIKTWPPVGLLEGCTTRFTAISSAHHPQKTETEGPWSGLCCVGHQYQHQESNQCTQR